MASTFDVCTKNVNELDNDGTSHLFRVCYYRSDLEVNVVKWLISVGANVNLGQVDSTFTITPLWIASSRGLNKIVAALIEAGAKADLWNTSTRTLPLHTAAVNGRTYCLLLLLEAFPGSVFIPNYHGCTSLHLASFMGSLECCRALLLAGSQVNALNDSMFLPIHYSIDSEVARLLIDFGSRGPRRDDTWVFPGINQFIEARKHLRTTSLSLLQLRRRRALGIGRNGRDLLRIVAQFIWSRRMITY